MRYFYKDVFINRKTLKAEYKKSIPNKTQSIHKITEVNGNPISGEYKKKSYYWRD